MIAKGSIVDVQLTSDTGFSTPDAVIQAASGIISGNGASTVVSTQVLNGSLAGQIGNMALSLNYDLPFQVDVKCLCNMDRAQAQDVADDVASAFQQVTGNYPTSVSAVAVTTPNSSVANPTGLPAITPQGVGGSGAGAAPAITGITNQVSSWFGQLTSLGTNLLIGLAAIIILAIVLIAYGPNIGKIASRA